MAAREAVRDGARAPLLVAPTGAGKGTIAAYLISSAATRRRPSLFLVHREEIIHDVAARVRTAGIRDVATFVAGTLMGSPAALANVCSVQSLTARTGFRPPADVVFIDEAHHATASTYRAVCEAYPNATLLGLTATPQRADGSALGDVFDRLIVVASAAELTAEGWLVPVDVLAPAQRVRELAGEPVELWQRHAGRRQGVAFLPTLDASRAFAEALGPSAVHIDGTTPTAVRRAALEAFAAGRVRVLANVGVLTEGVDLPAAEVCLLARGCDGVSMYLQCVGRVLRTSPATGKTRALLIDARGAVHVHGLPDEERSYTLDGGGIARASDALPVRQCAACGAAFAPAPVCPRCGAAMPPLPTPKVKARPMRIVSEADLVKIEKKKAAFAEMVADCRARGFKPGAALFEFKKLFGHWPTAEMRRTA